MSLGLGWGLGIRSAVVSMFPEAMDADGTRDVFPSWGLCNTRPGWFGVRLGACM